MDQKGQERLKHLLNTQTSEVATFISDMDLSSARTSALPLIKALRDVGPTRVRGQDEPETYGHRLMRLINAGLSLAEERRSRGSSITQRECHKMAAAFERISGEALQRVQSTILDDPETGRSRVYADPLTADPDSPEEQEKELREGLKLQLTQYDASKGSLLRDIIKHGYTFQKAPVVALCKPFLRINEAGKYFNVDSFGSYPVLKQQFVLGASDEFALKWTKRIPEKEKKEMFRRNMTIHSRIRQTFQVLLEALNTKYPNKKFMLIGAPYRWENAYWGWVMMEKDFDLLRRCSTNPGTLDITQWGLALSTEN